MLLVLVVHLDVQVKSADEIFFGLRESTSADTNYVVLPLVFVLVTALMAALALPLGPLLKSLPPLQAYAFDICGSMAGIAGFARAVVAVDPARWSGSASWPSCCCCWGWATVWARGRRSAA